MMADSGQAGTGDKITNHFRSDFKKIILRNHVLKGQVSVEIFNNYYKSSIGESDTESEAPNHLYVRGVAQGL